MNGRRARSDYILCYHQAAAGCAAKSVQLRLDDEGGSLGSAFVAYESPMAAARACHQIAGLQFEGRLVSFLTGLGKNYTALTFVRQLRAEFRRVDATGHHAAPTYHPPTEEAAVLWLKLKAFAVS